MKYMLMISNTSTLYQKCSYSLLNLLSNIGGLIYITFIIFGAIVQPYSHYDLMLSLIENLYVLKKSDSKDT